ncbi:autism susceptibility gene 2-like protein [Labeo rohita]|uniref:Autism susceptibility gene 2-like protein n=1 Tax=Labeo rohita TaxID=84645 RepID=A0A498NG67_LABRO|nr:autism susceptibility gene 2-like protein [Labeo rohita]
MEVGLVAAQGLLAGDGRPFESLSLLSQAGRKMEETEVNAAPRSSSKDRLSEAYLSISEREKDADSQRSAEPVRSRPVAPGPDAALTLAL